MNRTCKKCEQVKPIEEFSFNSPNGRRKWACRECRARYARERQNSSDQKAKREESLKISRSKAAEKKALRDAALREDVEFLLSQGLSVSEIAKRRGIRRDSLAQNMRRIGMDVPKKPQVYGIRQSLGPEECEEILQKMTRWWLRRYQRQGLSIQQISKIEDWSFSQTRKIAKRHGFVFRDERQAA